MLWVIIHWNSVAGVPDVNSFNNGVGMSTLGMRLSGAGSIISLVCAVHCALTPLALLALPFLAAQYGGVFSGIVDSVFSQSTEWLFLGAIAVIAGGGVLATYPVHRDGRPATFTMAGFLTLLLVRSVAEEGSSLELVGNLIGASLIAWGGFMNRSLCRCHPCHERDDKTEASQPLPASTGS
ncbi:MAG: MerC domain-containing protein [Nitrospira sp. SB0672_bin_25]|nr:MerC domain-containing protein [Nitrospira sp. SB0672_bin_25]